KEAVAKQKEAEAKAAEALVKEMQKKEAPAPAPPARKDSDKLIPLNAKQKDVVAQAIANATGLSLDKVLEVLKDATIRGKIDASQLLGALQSLVKPSLNVNKLLDELQKAADKLGSPAGDKVKELIKALKDLLGLDKKAPDKKGLAGGASEVDIRKALKELAKKMADKINDKKGGADELKRGKAVCHVYQDGKQLALDQSKIVTCVVNQHVDLVDSFALTLTDNDLKLSSDKTFAEGNKLGIELGWEGGKLGVVMTGEITGRELDFPRRGPVLLTIHGLSIDHHLNRGRFTRQFCKEAGKFETRDSDVARSIADECKLDVGHIDETPVKFEYIFQNNLTNLEFLRHRAQLYNYEVGVDLDESDHKPKFFFRKLPIKKQAELKLKRGRDLKHFRARMNLACQVPKVLVRGWDWKNASPTEITATADKADLLDDMGLQKLGPDVIAGFVGKAQMKPKPDGIVEVVTSKPVISTEHAKTIAKSVLNYYAYGFVTGDGSTFGDPALHAGSTIELDAVGKRFEGKYYVQSCSHVFEAKGYTTMFNLYRPGITPEGKQDNIPDNPPPAPPKPPQEKTFFEFLAEGLKQIPLATAPARLKELQVDKDFQDQDLDAQAEIKKPNIDPGKFTVQIKEIVGGTWGAPDPADSDAERAAEKKAAAEAKKHQVENLKFGYQG
ncbi:MAG TPA: hypothetical protein VHF22_07970, partial [Planctomycetota bacterium]|nr:hypothetical protein [Planctomycetota bacterium]